MAKVSVMARSDVMTPEVEHVLRRRVNGEKALSHVERPKLYVVKGFRTGGFLI